jgi:hypothetical protein
LKRINNRPPIDAVSTESWTIDDGRREVPMMDEKAGMMDEKTQTMDEKTQTR